MKRSRLTKFLIPSIIVHLILITFILLYFVESNGEGETGSIIVGVISSEGIDSAERKTEKAEREKLQDPAKRDLQESEVKQKPLRKIENKELTPLKTERTIPSISEYNRKTKAGENKRTVTKKENLAASTNTSQDSYKGLQTAGKDTAKPESKGESAGIVTNPAPNAGLMKSARPDYKINPTPRYPLTARRRGYEGDVHLRVYVLENGRVGKIELEKPSGYEVLDESALEAVKDWVFIPGTRDGRETASWVTVPISFRLDKG